DPAHARHAGGDAARGARQPAALHPGARHGARPADPRAHPAMSRPANQAFDAIAVGRRVLAAEAEALGQLSERLDDTFARAVETLFAAQKGEKGGRIVCTGIGKSGHVARKIAATLASTGSVAMFVHATEASHGDLGMIGADDVIL